MKNIELQCKASTRTYDWTASHRCPYTPLAPCCTSYSSTTCVRSRTTGQARGEKRAANFTSSSVNYLKLFLLQVTVLLQQLDPLLVPLPQHGQLLLQRVDVVLFVQQLSG